MPEREAMVREHAAVRIHVLSGRAALQVRSWMPERTAGGRIVTLGGRELPSLVGATLSGQTRVLCVGPADWLVVSEALAISCLREYLGPQTRQQGFAVVDLTHGLAVLRIQGRAARELLSMGCGIDVHPRSFPPGRCARTCFAQVPVIIECVERLQQFELYVARSYLAYLQSWLIDAAAEFEEAME